MSAAGADLVFATVDSIGRISSLQDYPREGYYDRLKLSIFSSFADISPQGLLVIVNSELEKHIQPICLSFWPCLAFENTIYGWSDFSKLIIGLRM